MNARVPSLRPQKSVREHSGSHKIVIADARITSDFSNTMFSFSKHSTALCRHDHELVRCADRELNFHNSFINSSSAQICTPALSASRGRTLRFAHHLGIERGLLPRAGRSLRRACPASNGPSRQGNLRAYGDDLAKIVRACGEAAGRVRSKER